MNRVTTTFLHALDVWGELASPLTHHPWFPRLGYPPSYSRVCMHACVLHVYSTSVQYPIAFGTIVRMDIHCVPGIFHSPWKEPSYKGTETAQLARPNHTSQHNAKHLSLKIWQTQTLCIYMNMYKRCQKKTQLFP